MMLSFGSLWAGAIIYTTLTTIMGQDDSPEYKITGTKRDTHCKMYSAQDRVIEQSSAESISSVVH